MKPEDDIVVATDEAVEPFDSPSRYQDMDASEVHSSNLDQSFPHGKLLLAAEVEERTTLDIRTIDRMIAADAFPASIRLSPRRRAWEESAINRWLAAPQSWVCF